MSINESRKVGKSEGGIKSINESRKVALGDPESRKVGKSA